MSNEARTISIERIPQDEEFAGYFRVRDGFGNIISRAAYLSDYDALRSYHLLPAFRVATILGQPHHCPRCDGVAAGEARIAAEAARKAARA